MAKFNIWDILHTLTTERTVEIKANNLRSDHNSIYKMLKARKVSDLVNIGKDADRGTIILSKQSLQKHK